MTLEAVRSVTRAELEQALTEHRVVPVYQPCFDLRTGAVVAVECLARIRDTETGYLLPPAAFVPAAETYGLVSRVDAAIAEQAITQVAAWRARYPGQGLCLAINVSVAALDNPRLPDDLMLVATAAGLPFDALVIEVTETILSRAGRGHEAVLARLSAAGCNVTLDDFGTGNSSFAYLQRFQVQGLKIDRSFVRALGTGDRPERTVERFVQFCLDLDVHVVAEGIENDSQLEILKRLGCPFGQGFLLSPPLTVEALEELLTSAAPAGTGRTPTATSALITKAAPDERWSRVQGRPRSASERARWSDHLVAPLALLVALALLGLAGLTVQSHRRTNASLIAAGQDKLDAVSALAASAVGSELSGLDDLVTAHSRREAAMQAINATAPDIQASTLEALRTASTSIFSASLYDARGRLLALQPAAPGLVGRSFAFRDWYRGASVSRHAYLSEPFQLMTPGRPWALASASAIRDRKGEVAGFLVATYAVAGLQQLVDQLATQHAVNMTVIDRRGQLLAAPRAASEIGQPGARTQDTRVLAALGSGARGPSTNRDVGEQWTTAAIPHVGGVILAEQPVQAALAGYAGQAEQNRLILTAVAVLALSLIALLLRADRSRRRLLVALGAREAFLETVLTEVDAGVVACDAAGRVTYSNARDEEARALLAQALQRQRPTGSVEFKHTTGEGRSTRQRASARPMRDRHGQLLGAVLVTHDITDLDLQRRKLREASEWVSALLEATPTAVVMTGPEGSVQQANQACVRLLGVPLDELVSTPLSDWVSFGVESGDPHDVAIAALPGQNGSLRTVEVRTRSLHDPRGEVVLMHSLIDVTPHRLERERLRRQGQTDALTGLANRHALQDRLADLVSTSEGDAAATTALIFLDLDGFKAVNDTLGHRAGDRLLTHVADALVAASRHDDLVARLGGDEFVVLAHLDGSAESQEISSRLRRAVTAATRAAVGQAEVRVDVSIGIALIGPDGQDPDELLNVADRRMYAAKRGPREAVAIPRPSEPPINRASGLRR